jgi:pimeloyl-ACP methyl ester carboxylesterase
MEIQPYRIHVPQDDLDDLRDRLARTRWAPPGDDRYGVPVSEVARLVEHWRTRYDWRTWERRLNTHPQFTTVIDGATVHFLHLRSGTPGALPLILTHGWPGSIAEYLDLLGPLSAYDLVVPALPGCGFGGPAPDAGWGPRRIARAWAELMRRLGYDRYGAVGNDWGSAISVELGRIAPTHVAGVHVTQAWSAPPPDHDPHDLSETDQAAWAAFQDWTENHASYGAVHAEQPQTLAHALADSPAGLLGWNLQAMRDLDPNVLLTHVSIHWLSGTAGSAIRIYAESRHDGPPGPTTVPLGVAQFPHDLASVRAFAEHQHATIVSWNTFDRGSHYAAHDAPDLLAADIHQFFRTVGQGR